MDKLKVVDIIVKILRRYDLILVMEVRDSSGTVADELLELLNKDFEYEYKYVISKRLGRSNCKEQYLFFYRTGVLVPEDTYQYRDKADAFERPPFTVAWKSKTTELERFATMCLHAKPDDVVDELNALPAVVELAKDRLGVKYVIIAGDLNADGSYLSAGKLRGTRLWRDKSYEWLIERHTDTTVTDSDAAYDHIILNSRVLKDAMVPASDKTYKFDVDLGISKELACKVSDHYPVEIQLKGKVNHALQQTYTVSKPSLVIHRNTPIKVSAIRAVGNRPRRCTGFKIRKLKYGSRISTICAVTYCTTADAAVRRLHSFGSTYPGTVEPQMIAVAQGHCGMLSLDPYVPGAVAVKQKAIRVEIELELTGSCCVRLVRETDKIPKKRSTTGRDA